MSAALPLQLLALAALVPLALVPLRPGAGRNAAFWGALVLSVLASAMVILPQVGGHWSAGFGATLRIGLAVTLLLFALLNLLEAQAWRLAPLLLPYLIVLGLLALIFGGDPNRSLAAPPFAWLELHIVVSVVTYGLLTLASVAALAGFLQERALKTKRPTNLSRLLPAVAESERLTGRLLIASEVVLGLGLVTGIATLHTETGSLLKLDHKALLSILAFVVIGSLIAAQRLAGVRGRLATRLLLVAYLLLTLAYPGVKFVQQVLLV